MTIGSTPALQRSMAITVRARLRRNVAAAVVVLMGMLLLSKQVQGSPAFGEGSEVFATTEAIKPLAQNSSVDAPSPSTSASTASTPDVDPIPLYIPGDTSYTPNDVDAPSLSTHDATSGLQEVEPIPNYIPGETSYTPNDVDALADDSPFGDGDAPSSSIESAEAQEVDEPVPIYIPGDTTYTSNDVDALADDNVLGGDVDGLADFDSNGGQLVDVDNIDVLGDDDSFDAANSPDPEEGLGGDDQAVIGGNGYQTYGENGSNVSAPGAPPGFGVNELNNSSSNSSDSNVEGLSLASSGGCQTGNMIDDCWRCNPNWASRRQSLANCAAGFGKCAVGGRNGPIYVVTSPRDDDPAAPKQGTLRYAVTRPGPLWITFKYSMTIKLKLELIMTSYKTIDARGVTVRIAGGAGITLQRVSNVIIHGLYIHDVKPTGPGKVMSSTNHVGKRGRSDGDAISVFSSTCVWIDHCYFARGQDGLIDVIRGSSMVTISNNFFTQHDKVILLGAHKDDYQDRDMRVTIMLNVFGPGLVQRMPRVRFGSCHVVNNDYSSGWGIYAIGGSESPVLNCEGNLFQPGRGPKGVAKKVWDGGGMYGGPDKWPWKATGNLFENGAYFTTSGPGAGAQVYSKATSCTARPAYMVERMTRTAGPLYNCKVGSRC